MKNTLHNLDKRPAPALGIIDDIVGTATSIFDSVKDAIYTDSIFIRYRDKCFAIIFANFPRSVYDPILAKHELGHSSIPDRKIGKTYAPEFARLHDAIAELLDTRKPGWGEVFRAKSAEIASRYLAADPDRSYKGAPDEALAWVLANPNATVSTTQPNVMETRTTTTTTSDGSNAAEASMKPPFLFNVTPNVRMLLIAGGVAVLGGVAYLVTRSGKGKSAKK